MDKLNIFFTVGASLSEDSFIPVSQIKEIKEEMMEVSRFLQVDISYLYRIKDNSLDRYCYLDLDLGLLVSLLDGKLDTIKEFNIKKQIDEEEGYLQKALAEEDYYAYFSSVDYKLRIVMLNRKFEIIPKEIKYQVFEAVYFSLDYGFEYIKDNIYEQVKALKPKNIEKNLEGKLDRDGRLTIYRGVTDNSTNTYKANSWTASLSVAAQFATSFNCEKPIVYKAKVETKDIIAYIKDRREEEIVVLPEDVKSIERMDLATMESLYKDYPFTISQITSISQNISADLNIPRYMKRIGIHSTDHFKRVLFHSLILARMESLNNIEKDILIEASRYHDIGRGNDAICFKHGIESYKILEESNILDKYPEEERETIRYVIENHCIHDKDFIPIEKYKIENRDRAKRLLAIFKDADALDRVRIRDLDTNYLRTDFAETLTLVAYQLLEYGF